MADASKYHIPYTNSKTGEVRWKEVSTSVTCANRPVVTAAEWAGLPTTQPEVKAGYNFKKKLVCGTTAEDDITVTANPADFVETSTDDPTTPLPTDGTAWTAGNPNDKDDQGKSVTYSDPIYLKDQTTQS